MRTAGPPPPPPHPQYPQRPQRLHPPPTPPHPPHPTVSAHPSLQSIDAGRRQYADILADLGFLPGTYPASLADVRREGGLGQLAPHELDQFSDQARIVKAALCAGFYPQASPGLARALPQPCLCGVGPGWLLPPTRS